MSVATRERRCIVTGEVCDESALIRFALGPDGRVVPDVAAKLPGRGAWVRSMRDVVEVASHGEPFARAFKCKVSPCGDLASLVETQLSRRCLDMLGLARKSGEVVSGFEKVRSWLASGRAAVLLHARNGSRRERRRLSGFGSPVTALVLFDDKELGLALGRESVVHAAVAAGGFADRLICESSRLAGFRTLQVQGCD